MPKLYDLKEIVEATGLPERTVRYYLAEVLDAPSGTPGRKAYYDQLTVDQLMLAQQILAREYDPEKGEVKPTLREFRQWLDGLDPDEIRRLVAAPYRVKPKALTRGEVLRRVRVPSPGKPSAREPSRSASADRGVAFSRAAPQMPRRTPESRGEENRDFPREDIDHFNMPAFMRVKPEEDKPAEQSNPRDSASNYLDRVMGPAPQQRSGGSRAAPRWHTHRFGDELEIRVRKALSPEQQRQLQLAGELLKSVIEGA